MERKRRHPDLGSPEFWEQLEANPSRLAAAVCFIDATRLNQTMEGQPGLRAWVSAAYEVARSEESSAKWEVTKARARALIHAKQTKDEGGKSRTDKTAEAEADLAIDAEMQRLIAAEKKRGALRALSTAMEDRKDMLIQLSANRRQEERE